MIISFFYPAVFGSIVGVTIVLNLPLPSHERMKFIATALLFIEGKQRQSLHFYFIQKQSLLWAVGLYPHRSEGENSFKRSMILKLSTNAFRVMACFCDKQSQPVLVLFFTKCSMKRAGLQIWKSVIRLKELTWHKNRHQYCSSITEHLSSMHRPWGQSSEAQH